MSSKTLNLDLIDAPDFAASRTSGRATWDERGNSIWEWQTEPGVFTREVSQQQLQALQANELQVIDEYIDTATFADLASMWPRPRHTAPRKLSRDTELVMPMRARVLA